MNHSFVISTLCVTITLAGCGVQSSHVKSSHVKPAVSGTGTTSKSQIDTPWTPTPTTSRSTSPSSTDVACKYVMPTHPSNWNSATVTMLPWCASIPVQGASFVSGTASLPKDSGYVLNVDQAITLAANLSYEHLSRATKVYVQPVAYAFTYGGVKYNLASAYIIAFTGPLGFVSSGPNPPSTSAPEVCMMAVNGGATSYPYGPIYQLLGC